MIMNALRMKSWKIIEKGGEKLSEHNQVEAYEESKEVGIYMKTQNGEKNEAN